MLVTTIDRIFYKSSHCCSARLKDFVNEDLMRNGWLLVALLFLLLSPSFRSVSVSVWRVCVHVCVCALCFGATAPSAGRNSSKYQHQFEALQNTRTRERKNVFICLHHFLFCKLRLYFSWCSIALFNIIWIWNTEHLSPFEWNKQRHSRF